MTEKKTSINLKDITDKPAHDYLCNKSVQYAHIKKNKITDRQNEIKKIRKQTLLWAAFYGAMGIFLLFIPQYIFNESFSRNEYIIPFINYHFELSIFELLYGFFLVGIEIWLLIKGDLTAVSKIAAVYGHNAKQKNFAGKELVYIGLGKDKKRFTEIGINPYQTLSKPSVLFLRLLFLARAFLSNFIFKIIIKRVLGRLAIRAVIDLAGMPIYAIWNAFASSIVIRKTDMRMKAVMQMNKTGEHFLNLYYENNDFRNLLYDTFEYIAITKKSFYPTDYIFALHFFKIFNITIKEEHQLSDNYLEKIKDLPKSLKLAIGQILIIGFLLDGRIGSFEKTIIKKLNKNRIIPYNTDEIKIWAKNYKTGKGFDEMFLSEKNL